MKDKYIHIRLCQWAECITKGNIVAMGERHWTIESPLDGVEVLSARLSNIKETGAAVDSLEDNIKRVVYMYYIEMRPKQQMSSILGVTMVTVNKLLEEVGYRIQEYLQGAHHKRSE